MPIVAREHFNRWYSAKAYYFALTFTDFPLQFVCVLIYIGITYLMTAQPLETFRLIYFIIMTTLLAMISQSIGMIVGAAFGVRVYANRRIFEFIQIYIYRYIFCWAFFQLGVVIGPLLQAPPLIFSGFFAPLSNASPYLHWLFHISYLRYALEGSMDALFGHNRSKLPCNEIYCHYQIPAKFIKEIDMQRNEFYSAFVILVIVCLCLRTFAFAVIARRLKRR